MGVNDIVDGVNNIEDINDYIYADGYKALAIVLTEMTPEKVVEAIKTSGLRGRGGAGRGGTRICPGHGTA